jgi:hypothetical protein
LPACLSVNGYTPVGPGGIARLLDFGHARAHQSAANGGDRAAEAGPDGLLAKLGIDGIIVARDVALPSPLPDNWKWVHGTWEGDVWHRDVDLPHVRALPDERFADATVKIIENSRPARGSRRSRHRCDATSVARVLARILPWLSRDLER